MVLAQEYVPLKRFQVVSAREFLRHPEKYGLEGEWIERTVES
jgi:hypothetical protein